MGAMGFFTVTTVLTTNNGDPVFFVFEAAKASDLEEFQDRLATDGTVLGTRYRIHPKDRRLIGAKKILLSHAGLVHVVEFPEAATFPKGDHNRGDD